MFGVLWHFTIVWMLLCVSHIYPCIIYIYTYIICVHYIASGFPLFFFPKKIKGNKNEKKRDSTNNDLCYCILRYCVFTTMHTGIVSSNLLSLYLSYPCIQYLSRSFLSPKNSALMVQSIEKIICECEVDTDIFPYVIPMSAKVV